MVPIVHGIVLENQFIFEFLIELNTLTTPNYGELKHNLNINIADAW